MKKSADTIREFLNRVTGISFAGFGISLSPASESRLSVLTEPTPVIETETKANETHMIYPETKVEPFLWLGQSIVHWSISGMELAYQEFEIHAKNLDVMVAHPEDSADEFLSNHLGELDRAVSIKYGEVASNIFRFGLIVALLPLSFRDATQLRSLKLACESLALRSFGSDGLITTATFLKGLPCEIPEYADKVLELGVLLQKPIINGGGA